MNPTTAGKAADAKYDIVKFLLSVIVVLAHAHFTPPQASIWQRNIVPMFLLMSNTFLFSKLHKLPPEQHGQAILKFLKRNLWLYLFWLAVALPVNMVFNWPTYQDTSVVKVILKVIRKALFGDVFVASWYLPASIIGTLLVYFLCRKLGDKITLAICILAYIFATVRASYYPLVSDNLFIWRIYHYYEILFDYSPLSFPYALIWVYLGKCFGEGRFKDRPVWLLLVLFVVSCLGQDLEGILGRTITGSYYNESFFMTIPVSFFMFSLLRKMPVIRLSFTNRLRHFSTFLYVTHNISLLSLKYFNPWFDTPEGAFPLFALTVSISTVMFILAEWYRERFPQQKFAKLLLKVF